MDYPEDIDFILKENVKTLVDWINNEKGPFSPEYVDIWYQRYQQLSKIADVNSPQRSLEH